MERANVWIGILSGLPFLSVTARRIIIHHQALEAMCKALFAANAAAAADFKLVRKEKPLLLLFKLLVHFNLVMSWLALARTSMSCVNSVLANCL